MPGAGLFGAGLGGAGFGVTNQTAIPSPELLKSPYGPGNLDSPMIDPVTRDYKVDQYGNPYGMTRAQQYVELAILTSKGTCCIKTLGNRLKEIKVISESFQQEVQQTIRDALSEGVAEGIIEIVSVDVNRIGKNGAFINTRFRDLATGKEFERVI